MDYFLGARFVRMGLVTDGLFYTRWLIACSNSQHRRLPSGLFCAQRDPRI